MSKGDQAIEAVGGHIVDVVGIQPSRRKRNRENWLWEKNSGLTQRISEVITKNTTPQDGHGLPHTFVISRRFYISILFATSPLRPHIVFTSLLVTWLPADSSPLEPSTHWEHTLIIFEQNLYRAGMNSFFSQLFESMESKSIRNSARDSLSEPINHWAASWFGFPYARHPF